MSKLMFCNRHIRVGNTRLRIIVIENETCKRFIDWGVVVMYMRV